MQKPDSVRARLLGLRILSSGNPAIQICSTWTRGFASSPYDEFALVVSRTLVSQPYREPYHRKKYDDR
jgi:hypothetical protein